MIEKCDTLRNKIISLRYNSMFIMKFTNAYFQFILSASVDPRFPRLKLQNFKAIFFFIYIIDSLR